MEYSIGSRIKRAWNVFFSREPPNRSVEYYGTGYSYRPDRRRLSRNNDQTILGAIYNRIALDASTVDIRHVKLDSENQYLEDMDSELNNLFNLEANIDQSARAFKHDIYLSLIDEGSVAIVPIETDTDPDDGSFKILSARVGRIVDWFPQLFQNDSRTNTGQAAGHTSLKQHKLLVVVDIELLELGDLAALDSTQGVVVHVDKDGQQLMGLLALVLPGLLGELLSSKDSADIERFGDIRNGVVDSATIAGDITRRFISTDESIKPVQPEDSTPDKVTTGTFWDDIVYFTREECKCKCGGRYCNGYPAEMKESVMRIADAARKHFNAPADVISALRCQRHNANEGGVANSQHMYGEAMDIRIRGVSSEALYRFIISQPGVRYAYKINDTNVHFDIPKGSR